MNQRVKEIKLYATFTCPYCKMEKEWLDKKQISHKVIMVDMNPYEGQRMVEKTGQMGVPVTEITYQDDKSEFVIGYDQKKLSDILELD